MYLVSLVIDMSYPKKCYTTPCIIRVAFAEPERKRARINRLLIVRRRSDFDREFPARA